MNKVIAFTIGAAAGSVVTWLIVKEKYKKIADEEINDIREYYKNKEESYMVELIEGETNKAYVKKKKSKKNKKETKEYTELVDDLGYSRDIIKEYAMAEAALPDDAVFIEPGVEYVDPYIIAPTEYGELDDYKTKSWYYYTDLVLTNEDGEIISDAELLIGDALDHFGEYEEDSVYVRNENNKCDYEILKHMGSYNDINEENI